MDLTSLYYFSELCKDLNITKAASRLFISQQTLSYHIQRMENELGIQLLHRRPAPSLTCAGEQVLSFARDVVKNYTNLKDILSDMEQEERGVISIGADSMRISECLSVILPQFSKRYPNVELRLTNATSSQSEPLVLDGKLDFAIVLSGDQDSKLMVHPLLNDQVYFCVAESLLQRYYPDAEKLKKQALLGATVSSLSKLPVCINENRLGNKIKKCYEEENAEPKTYLTSADMRITTTTAFQEIAACFSTQYYLIHRRKEIPDTLNIFPVLYQGEPLTQHLSLIHRKDRYISRYSKYFLELLTQYFHGLEHIHMEKIIKTCD